MSERPSELPSRLRLLCVGVREPSWASLTLQLDAEDCLEPQFRWVSSSTEALSLLRDESFDCVLVGDEPGSTQTNSRTEPFALMRAIRASGCDDPVVLITAHITDQEWIEVCRKESEVLISPNLWESMALVPVIKRAISRVEVVRNNRYLAVSNQRRLLRERDEADHLLHQQRQIVRELESLALSKTDRNDELLPRETSSADTSAASFQKRRGWEPGSVDAQSGRGTWNEPICSAESAPAKLQLPEEVNEYYHELLRTYVIMGSGNLGSEIAQLAKLISVAGLSPREALALHLERVETLVHGLGNRSTRHVMARADLLALELTIHLGECYQRSSLSAVR